MTRGYLLISLLLFSACAYSLESRTNKGFGLASEAGLRSRLIDTGIFKLQSFSPDTSKTASPLYIYIEGDGLSWLDAATPSSNPTPSEPVGLELAMQQPGAVYIARPCQYVNAKTDANCADDKWWTSHRFSNEVITATNTAIDEIKKNSKAGSLILIGYSGGGAVAALVAARRSDVTKLITISGNLDIARWAQEKDITPLYGSLNPADAWQQLQRIQQLHFTGADDKTVPPSIANSYAAKFPAGSTPQVEVVKDFNHNCCWVKNWPAMLKQYGIAP